jgi:hypothetical protein
VSTTEFGAVRQIWLAPLDDPGDKSSFLIRDDARSKAGAVFGRTIRLGDPVSLGPNSTWKQTSWVGGTDQEVWRDEEMCKSSTLDLYSDPGKAKLHSAWGELYLGMITDRDTVGQLTFGRNAEGIWEATQLAIGEGENIFTPSTPSGNYKLYLVTPGTFPIYDGIVPVSYPSGIVALGPPDDGTAGIFVLLANGELHLTTPNGTPTWDDVLVYTETALPVNGMVAYGNSLFWLAGWYMRKRTHPDLLSAPTYSAIGPIAGAAYNRGLCVWNNRIWFGSMTLAKTARLFVSDGVTATMAVEFPEEFLISGMIPYNGALYIYGGRRGADLVSVKGVVYRYTGSTLTKLWEKGTGTDNENWNVFAATVQNGKLYWGRNATTSNGNRIGVMVYDSAVDAIYEGPTEAMGVSGSLVALDNYNQTIAAGMMFSNGDMTTRHVLERNIVKRDTSVAEGYILSSRFDGELPAEQKVWLKARLRVKIPAAGNSITFAVILDEGSEQTIDTVEYDASDTGWRTAEIPLKVSGDYLRSTTIQYKVYLTNSTAAALTASTPELDSVEVDYFPSPVKRRQWAVRVVASDDQLRLDGTANPLTTAQDLADKIEDFWGDQRPLLFWDATVDEAEPVTDGIEVMPLTFQEQTARQSSEADDLVGEIAFGFYEVV